MKLKMSFTPSARAEFLTALAYIHRENPQAAKQFRQQVEKALRRLEAFPDSGRSLPEFPELPHREVIVRPYRFFYRVVDQTVWVVAVWHGARLPHPPGELNAVG